MGDYQRVLTEAEAELHLNSSHLSRQSIYYVKPMSFLHKTAFVSSILFCVIVVIIFIWGLPCHLNDCVQENNNESVSWVKTLNGLARNPKDTFGIGFACKEICLNLPRGAWFDRWRDRLLSHCLASSGLNYTVMLKLKGRMHLIGGTLVAIFRSAKWGITQKESSKGRPKEGGVIALAGKTGQDAYWIPMGILPKYIDCSLLGANSNSYKPCLIVGEKGYLAAINPISGLLQWTIRASGDSPTPQDIDLPVLVPDQDGDGVNDLSTLSRFESGHHRLIFISSTTGVVIKQVQLDEECAQVNNLTFDYNRVSLFYTCSNQIKSRVSEYHLSNNRKASLQPDLSPVVIPDEEKERFLIENESSGEHKIVVNNSGTCPENCYVSVNLTDQKNKTIWSFHRDKTYIMSPVSLHFKHSVSGFLLKLWHWHTPERRIKSVDGLTVELITERTVLITFNKSYSMHVANTSQTDIVQLCYDNECQPHVSFQTQSALIADLNGDGAQDLISYFVTYKTNNVDPLSIKNKSSVADWTLESRIKVVRLEADLPKLYEAVSKH